MVFAEDVINLRKRMMDAVSRGVVSQDNKETFEATLIQIMNDAERQRQSCVTQADNFRRQASVVDGQASAFASVSSIVYGVLNAFVTLAEKDERERKAREEERKAHEEDLNKALELEKQNSSESDKKKSSKKKPQLA